MTLRQRRFIKAGVVVVSVGVVALCVWLGVSILNLDRTIYVTGQLRVLSMAVTEANLHIRNATVAPTLPEVKSNLNLRFVTRERADKVYANLKVFKWESESQKQLWGTIEQNRIPYREAQNALVTKILDNPDNNKEIWPALQAYQVYQLKYKELLGMLLDDVVKSAYFKYKVLLVIASTNLIAMLVLANAGISCFSKKYLDRRKCYDCGCTLHGNFSLAFRSVVEGQEKLYRICSSCFDKRYPKLEDYCDHRILQGECRSGVLSEKVRHFNGGVVVPTEEVKTRA